MTSNYRESYLTKLDKLVLEILQGLEHFSFESTSFLLGCWMMVIDRIIYIYLYIYICIYRYIIAIIVLILHSSLYWYLIVPVYEYHCDNRNDIISYVIVKRL